MRDRLREWGILVDERDLGVRILFLEGFQRSREILAGRRIDLEEILVAELVGLLLGSAGRDHDLTVLLGHDRGACGQPRGIRAEQELRLVLRDQARVELLDPRALGFVIVAGEVDHVVLPARGDPAGGIDFVPPQFEAAHLGGRVVVELAGLRVREPDCQGVGCCQRRGRTSQCGRQNDPKCFRSHLFLRDPLPGTAHSRLPSGRRATKFARLIVISLNRRRTDRFSCRFIVST